MEFKIETGIPVPPHQNAKYPFAEMTPGSSFFIPSGDLKKISNAAVGFARYRRDRKFTCRTVTENGVAGVRVWRIE